MFEPIAIIGQGCVLPGCFTPEELWRMVYENRVEIGPANPDAWRVDLAEVMVPQGETSSYDKAWCSHGGYVTGFEKHFDARSFEIEAEIIEDLDPVFKWSFYAAQAALKDAGYLGHDVANRTGLIMGNLSYPTHSFSQYFEETYLQKLFPEWELKTKPVAAVNRFMSGLPAMLTAKALGLKGDAFALDAACASSLYALKLGCDKLNNGSADMMLIGGVCASDQLFLHVGFTALNALSPTGQSRPFNAGADGLVPSEGAGFVVIKRLKDAVKQKDNILGVIRGIGLSNDGKQGGFLSPSQSGQVRSMKQALAVSGVSREDVGYIECHATGTSAGDSVEIRSMREVYGNSANIRLSSLKGNIGHSITASGIGSIIKVLGALNEKILPPTPNAFPLNAGLMDGGFTISDKPDQWACDKNRVAAISNFGFGGNNAHVIIEEWDPKTKYAASKRPGKKSKIAILGVEVQNEKFANSKEYLSHLLDWSAAEGRREQITLDVKKLHSPPSDIKHALSQQLLMLDTTQKLLDAGVNLDKTNTGVFIGMGVDAEINRYLFRRRIKELLDKSGFTNDQYDLSQLEDSISSGINAAVVIGTMPNIPANRINSNFDFSGPGFTVSAEELSGLKALDIAINAIRNGEISSAIVGAVDISDEFVNRSALADVIDVRLPASDAAVAIALKNYDEAVKDGDTIVATIDWESDRADQFTIGEEFVFSKFGYAHAASGLSVLATAILLTQNRLRANDDVTGLIPLLENEKGFAYQVKCISLFGGQNEFYIDPEPIKEIATRATGELLVHCYAADTHAELLKAVERNEYSQSGVHRLGIISSANDLKERRDEAVRLLQQAKDATGWLRPYIHYRYKKVEGELAFVFTGAASAYQQMGKTLLQEFPALAGGLRPYCNRPDLAGEWIFERDTKRAQLPFCQLAGSSLLCQVHAVFTQKILGLRPHAALGLSSGETNSMFALGVWNDMDALLADTGGSELYRSALGVAFNSVKEHWELAAHQEVNWENWRILAPLAEVQEVLAKEEKAYLTIINTQNDFAIGGDSEACRRIINAVGGDRAVQVSHDIAVHCAAVKPFEKSWRELHTRTVNDVEGVRFYSNYLDGVYEPTIERVADALTGQALQPIDFPKIIEKAFADGVRIFVEHGPRNSLSTAIKEILKDRECLCVSLDRFGQSGLVEALRASTELWCAGVPVDLSAIAAAKSEVSSKQPIEIVVPLHMKEILSIPVLNKKETPTTTVSSSLNIKAGLELAPGIAVTKRNRNQAAPIIMPKQEEKFNHSHIQIERKQLPAIEQKNESVSQVAVPVNTQASSVFELLATHHADMLKAHENFLEVQLQAQEQFNELMNHMMRQVTGGAGSAPFVLPEVADSTFAAPLPDVVQASVENTVAADAVGEERISSDVSFPIAQSAATPASNLPGPKFSREQLETLASGRISSIFGPLFEKQDQYNVQVRMPEPPLLLCDRVTGIKGEPGTLGLGTIWTETDVTDKSWYLHNNRMPPGIFIEAGQADLLLISYLGIDFQNQGKRAYRLLGCELVFLDELPKPGDTLKYDIHVDGYAKSGDTTLFFFHYDCHINGKLRISVRNGQAGFFTTEELADSKGVIWTPESASYAADSKVLFANATKKHAFSPTEIEAYTNGDMVACFGEELGWTLTHTRTPRSQGGHQNFIKNVTNFDLAGGPAKRGYMKSETIVSPDDWYFNGHFKNDPCMPGTLMADACLQMMAFYMVGTGMTAMKDGWRFEPVTNVKYKFVCRGQVIPSSKNVTYEVFVDEITDGEFPTMYAHVLTTVDGTKAFLCERLGLRLVPDWPLATMKHLVAEDVAGKKVAAYNGFKFGYGSLLNCALGRPALAFGPDFKHYDNGGRTPRLPGPPYHFMTRIAEYHATPGNYKNNPFVVAEYDVPHDAWYFAENGRTTMPYAVLMEVALQPCGWLSTFLCQHELKGKDLVFRNLDGKAVQHRMVTPSDKTIVTKTTLTGLSIMGEVIIVKFEVVSSIGDQPVFTMNTVFGFFDSDSMKSQKGLAVANEEQTNLTLNSNVDVALTKFKDEYFRASTARLPSSKLLMISRVAAFYPDGGKFGKGYIRAEKDVDKSEWFFKAHFFQDPVQPGSLGVEAMVQLIQFYILQQGLHQKFVAPYFEPIAIEQETEWHYRGQVTPDKKLITIDFDVKEIIETDNSVTVNGEARLWVDGLKIYHAPMIGCRVTEQ